MSNNLIPQLVQGLNQLPPNYSKLNALKASGLLKPVMSLAEILKYQDILTRAHENDSKELEATERAVQKCLKLPAVPLEAHVPLGFLIGRVATYTPIQAEQMRLLPNIIRLAQVASLFGLDDEFLTAKAKTDSPSSVDELIRQFLREVNDYHFPVFTDYWSDDETWQNPALGGALPVKPRGFNHWYYDDPITLFMALAGLEEDPHPALDILETDYPQFDIPWGFKLSHLLPALDRTPLDGSLKFLPDLIRMVTRRTGSFFLDHSPEEYDFYSDRGG